MSLGADYLEIRYEELRAMPEVEMQKVVDFIGCSESAAELVDRAQTEPHVAGSWVPDIARREPHGFDIRTRAANPQYGEALHNWALQQTDPDLVKSLGYDLDPVSWPTWLKCKAIDTWRRSGERIHRFRSGPSIGR